MTAYDLNRLNDKEFEALAVRIVQEQVGNRVERFKPGKDAGVDGRFLWLARRRALSKQSIGNVRAWRRS